MSFNRVKFSHSGQDRRSFKEAMIAAATYEPKRSMSNTRLIGSALSIIFGLFMAYAAMFYVPAFVNFNKVMSVTGMQNQAPVQTVAGKEKNFLSPYMDLFKLRRGFFRAGQKLQVEYALSPGTELVITVKKCNAPRIIEIFRCESFQEQNITISKPLKGGQTFQIGAPGFYYYSERTQNRDNSAEIKPFAVQWKRRH